MSEQHQPTSTTDAPQGTSRRPVVSESNRLWATETLGAWVDPTDVADRQAWSRDRSADAYERPPHY